MVTRFFGEMERRGYQLNVHERAQVLGQGEHVHMTDGRTIYLPAVFEDPNYAHAHVVQGDGEKGKQVTTSFFGKQYVVRIEDHTGRLIVERNFSATDDFDIIDSV